MSRIKEPASHLGPEYGTGNRSAKIKAVDGVPGVVILLSYWAGGHNFFPKKMEPTMYMEDERLEGRAIQTDLSMLKELIRDLCLTTGIEIKGLEPSSFPIYMSALRNGRRPGGHDFPAVKTTYSRTTGILVVWPRNWDSDLASGVDKLLPHWVQCLIKEREKNV